MAAAEACGAAAACDATDARAPLASRLRSGRFSVVQSAVHLKEKARYAVKVVENKSLGDEENLEALETEVRSVCRTVGVVACDILGLHITHHHFPITRTSPRTRGGRPVGHVLRPPPPPP